MMNVVIFVIDKTLWALRPMAYLLNKYWGSDQDFLIAGFNQPDFDLPSNYQFYSIGNFKDYPADRWSNAVSDFLDWYPHDQFILLLEDYWLKSPVDVSALNKVYEYTKTHHAAENILRTDLINDGGVWRENQKQNIIMNGVPGYEKPVNRDYDCSLQASIWNKQKMRDLMIPNENPWIFEKEAQRRAKPGSKIITSKERLLDYYIVISSQHGGYYHLGLINQDDARYIRSQGWLEGVSLRESFDGS